MQPHRTTQTPYRPAVAATSLLIVSILAVQLGVSSEVIMLILFIAYGTANRTT